MRILVVFFSHGAITRQVAEEIALRCGADMEEIRDSRPSVGAFTALRLVWDSLTGATPPIAPAQRDPADYDLVILGTPGSIGHVASPIRSYVRGNAYRFKRVAFFCTEGGRGGRRVFAELRELCRQRPASTLFLTKRFLADGDQEPLKNFLRRLTMT